MEVRRIRAATGWALLGLAFANVPAWSQPVNDVACDAGAARSASDGPRGYAPRGDRCEGTFNREVSGSSFRVAGFYESFGPFDPAASSLPLSWTVPDTGLVHVRIRSLREGGELYGMDTQLLPGTTGFAWPTDFLRILRLEPAQLAPAAFLELDGKAVFLPIRVSPATDEAPAAYTLTVLSVERMERVFLTVAPVDRVGDLATGDFVVVNQPVPGTPYTSGRPIQVTIEGLQRPGLYVAQILGLTSGGDRRELNVWFYHDRERSSDPAPR